MRRSLSPPPPPAPPRHAQRRRFIPAGRREALLGLAIGAWVALVFIASWLALGAPL